MIDGFWAVLGALIGAVIGATLGFFLGGTYAELVLPETGLEAIGPISAGFLIGGWTGIVGGAWAVLRWRHIARADRVGGILLVVCLLGVILTWRLLGVPWPPV